MVPGVFSSVIKAELFGLDATESWKCPTQILLFMIPSGISNTYTLYKRDRAGNCLKLFPIQYTLTC